MTTIQAYFYFQLKSDLENSRSSVIPPRPGCRCPTAHAQMRWHRPLGCASVNFDFFITTNYNFTLLLPPKISNYQLSSLTGRLLPVTIV